MIKQEIASRCEYGLSAGNGVYWCIYGKSNKYIQSLIRHFEGLPVCKKTRMSECVNFVYPLSRKDDENED